MLWILNLCINQKFVAANLALWMLTLRRRRRRRRPSYGRSGASKSMAICRLTWISRVTPLRSRLPRDVELCNQLSRQSVSKLDQRDPLCYVSENVISGPRHSQATEDLQDELATGAAWWRLVLRGSLRAQLSVQVRLTCCNGLIFQRCWSYRLHVSN
jgi:hypothetical protein